MPRRNSGRGLGLVLLAAGGFLSLSYPARAADTPLRPPFKKVWSMPSSDLMFDVQVVGPRIFVAGTEPVCALDLRTGRWLWHAAPVKKRGASTRAPGSARDESSHSCRLTADRIAVYIASEDGSLAACSPATGAVQWSVPLTTPGLPNPLTVTTGTLYCVLQPGMLTALDTATHRPLWTARFQEQPVEREDERGLACAPLVEGETVLLASGTGGILALDRRTGKPRWQTSLRRPAGAAADAEHDADHVSGMIAPAGRLYATSYVGDLRAYDVVHGDPLWRFTSPGDTCLTAPAFLGENVIYTVGAGSLYAVDPASGKARWERVLPGANSVDPTFASLEATGPLVGAGQVIVGCGPTLCAFSAAGQPRWTWETGDDRPEPLRLLPNGILISTGEGWARLTPGPAPTFPQTPAARRALAANLVRRLPALTRGERRTLERLGPDAVTALVRHIHELVSQTKAGPRKPTAGRPGRISPRDDVGQELYGAVSDLCGLVRPADTGTLLTLYAFLRQQRVGPDELVLRTLAETGDDRALPLFLGLIRKPDRDAGHGAAIRFLARSRAPAAVRVLLSALQDPHADAVLRNAAFCNLPRTGGVEGVAAVVAARDVRRTVPSLAEEMQLDRLPREPAPAPAGRARPRSFARSELLATHRDAQGTVWGLVRCGILGSDGDLWLVRRDGERWAGPLFADATYSQPFVRSATAAKPYGLTEKEMLSGGWITHLIGNSELSRDTDGDGWTDLVERRLGTDPEKSDTDGDGLPDSGDRNPLAGQPAETEAEQILAAAFEARFRFIGERAVPCVVTLPPGMKPFELRGWDWLILQEREKRQLPVAALYGEGVGFVSFRMPEAFYTPGGRKKYRDGDFRQIGPERRDVTLELSTYYGGLDGTVYRLRLHRFGPGWAVTECVMIAIS